MTCWIFNWDLAGTSEQGKLIFFNVYWFPEGFQDRAGEDHDVSGDAEALDPHQWRPNKAIIQVEDAVYACLQ